MAGLMKVGEKAPDFSLRDQAGREISLREYQRNKNVVLYFYPKDDTPGCTKEACNFRDNLESFEENGAQILGVSVDSPESHQKFSKKYDLQFPILSDETKTVSKQYGVLNDKGYASRVTYVIDKQGIIRAVYPEVKVDEHWKELHTLLEGMQSKV